MQINLEMQARKTVFVIALLIFACFCLPERADAFNDIKGLRGVSEVVVMIETIEAPALEAGVVETKVREIVEQKLKAQKIRVIRLEEATSVPTLFNINIAAHKSITGGTLVYSVKAQLEQGVVPLSDLKNLHPTDDQAEAKKQLMDVTIYAAAWQTGRFGELLFNELPKSLYDELGEAMNNFSQDYDASNSKKDSGT